MPSSGYFTAKLDGRRGDVTGDEWFVIMFGTWGGVKACSTHRCLEPVRMDHRPAHGLGRARVEEEEKAAASGKTVKRLLRNLARFPVWSFRAKLFLVILRRRNMFVISERQLFPLLYPKLAFF